MTMRSLVLVLACLVCAHASESSSSSKALAQLLTASQKPVAESVADKIASVDESPIAEAIFGTAALVLAAFELNTQWEAVMAMEKEIKGSTTVTAAKFLLALESALVTATAVLPSKVFPDAVKLHEKEVAEVIFVTATLAIAIYELSQHWDAFVKVLKTEFKELLQGHGVKTVAKFAKVVQKSSKTVKKALYTYSKHR
mmetsp:Transcript_56743/g.99220  ORF Transcript_56743/g.99220 Transcript_56743/m.99220 type:complete len:198 (-) Transcript_56743:94-687(-)